MSNLHDRLNEFKKTFEYGRGLMAPSLRTPGHQENSLAVGSHVRSSEF